MDPGNITQYSQEEIQKYLDELNRSQGNGSGSEEVSCLLDGKLEDVPEGGCPRHFDSVLCWPGTSPGMVAILPCRAQFYGVRYDTTQNASRLCRLDGTWDQYTNYNSCREIPDVEHDGVEITTTIYFIGYTISLVALIVAVFIFWRFKDLRCLRNSIHMNLMCTYILSDFTWILTYVLQHSVLPSHFYTCLVILLHYFHLTNFFWMFVEGLYLYILVVKTFTGENIKLRIYAIIGWGAPIFFVLLWTIAKGLLLSQDDQQSRDLIGSWTPHPLDWIYQAPAITVLVVNMIFLVIIMWVLITKLRSATSAETQQYRKAAKALLVLIPLLGITYILVIVGPTDGISRNIYDSMRAVLLSTQGFSVALFYCFLNTDVKNTVRHHVNSWNTRRTVGSQRQRYGSSRDWSPRSRDSIRLYQSGRFFKKRESTGSEGTTTTLVVCPVATQGVGCGSSGSIGKQQEANRRSPLLPPGDFG